MNGKLLLIGIVLFSIFYAGCAGKTTHENDLADVKKFSSMAELKEFLEENKASVGTQYRYDGMLKNAMMPLGMQALAMEATADSGGTDYSQTNVQVEGVDEADFVKTDGEYLYIISGNRLVIVSAYPADDAEIVSQREIRGRPMEIFINGDDLVVFSEDIPIKIEDYAEEAIAPGYFYQGNVLIAQYDISDRSDPELVEQTAVEGDYFGSRMIGRHVYAVVNKYIYEDEMEPPVIYKNGILETGFPDVYYFDIPCPSYRYTTIISVDLDNQKEESRIFLTGGASNMYVSEGSIYVTHDTDIDLLEERNASEASGWSYEGREATSIHRISIDDGEIDVEASGYVPGHVLNQFSMDEYDGHFRIATTTGHVARSADDASSKNHVYVLDMDLDVVGKLEDLAPGEKIYSARFMGSKGYMVTFRKVDPLFVIDLSDPENPGVLGKLKIPGYSDYLHPVNETHVIGLGKEAIPADEGDFSWYQGVKLSLFDVSDVEKPKEVSKYVIGDRGTDSYALHDHRAFLFSAEKDLLVIPINLAEIDEEQYPAGVDPWQSGDYTFQGAYVFSVNDGFRLRGRISHSGDEEFDKMGYYYYSDNAVKRSLYIEDVLYTLSDSKVKMNDLESLEEIKEVSLPKEEAAPWYE